MFIGLLSLLIPDSRKIPISQFSIHSFKVLSLCLLAFLLGKPLTLTARIFNQFFIPFTWRGRLVQLSASDQSFSSLLLSYLTTHVSSVSYYVFPFRSVPPARLILILILSAILIICLVLRIPFISTFNLSVFMCFEMQSPSRYFSISYPLASKRAPVYILMLLHSCS